MSIVDSILNYIKEELIGSSQSVSLTTQDNLLISGLIDSMGVMKLVGFVEELTGTKIPPEDILVEHFMSVEAIENYINKRK